MKAYDVGDMFVSVTVVVNAVLTFPITKDGRTEPVVEICTPLINREFVWISVVFRISFV